MQGSPARIPPLQVPASKPARMPGADHFANRLRHWIWPLLAIVGAAAITVLYWFDPARSGFYPECSFHRLTGLNCPGCGGLRAAHRLLHGQVANAFRCNALVVMATPVMAALAIRWAWAIGRGRRASKESLSTAWLWALLVVMLAFALVRNLPFPLCAQLSP